MKPINHSILIKIDKSPQQILKKAEFLFMFFFNSCISFIIFFFIGAKWRNCEFCVRVVVWLFVFLVQFLCSNINKEVWGRRSRSILFELNSHWRGVKSDKIIRFNLFISRSLFLRIVGLELFNCNGNTNCGRRKMDLALGNSIDKTNQ